MIELLEWSVLEHGNSVAVMSALLKILLAAHGFELQAPIVHPHLFCLTHIL
jgi:hypothetical protein